MDNQFNKDLKKYKKRIKRMLLCSNSVAKKFFTDFDRELENYVEENNLSKIDEVYAQFGTAEDVARSFFELADIQKISKWVRLKTAILTVLVIALGISCLSIASTLEEVYYKEAYKGNLATSSALETQNNEMENVTVLPQ